MRKGLCFLSALVLIIIVSLSYAEYRFVKIYDLDFDVEDSSNEHPSEACTVQNGQDATTKQCCITNTDCELVIPEGTESIHINWNTVDDILGTHAATDWHLLVRAIAKKGDSYPTAGSTGGGDGTDPVSTYYYESGGTSGLGNDQYGGFGLTPGMYAMKIRVKTPSATVAAPSIRVMIEY